MLSPDPHGFGAESARGRTSPRPGTDFRKGKRERTGLRDQTGSPVLESTGCNSNLRQFHLRYRRAGMQPVGILRLNCVQLSGDGKSTVLAEWILADVRDFRSVLDQ